MSACVFLGPTLPVAEAREEFTAEYLPPVRQGDVYRAVRRLRPRAVGIIDGYFHQVPSVWHKEILWAMAEGVHVFGSASMGALRAAELQAFGMKGVGEIFAAFRDGNIEDDDEVAVVHGPAEIGFVAASEAMVNIRWTLRKARKHAVISAATQARLETIAKSLMYPSRVYAKIIEHGLREGLPENELSALRRWLDHGRLDIKRADALEMLRRMRNEIGNDPVPMRVAYTFEQTTMWEAAKSQVDTIDDAFTDQSIHDGERCVLDEARLEGSTYEQLKRAALLRLLVRRIAAEQRIEASREDVRQRTTQFRSRHRLSFASDFAGWLEDRDIDRDVFERLLADDVLVDKICADLAAQIEPCVVAQLRVNGDYARFDARVRAKRRALDVGEEGGRSADDPVAEMQAMAWFLTDRYGTHLSVDVHALAVRMGFRSSAEFRRSVRREFQFHLSTKAGHSK